MQCSFLQKCPAKGGDSLIYITPEGATIPIGRDSNNLPFCIGTIITPPVVTTVTAPAIANKTVSLPVLSSTEALSEHMKYGCMPFASLARLLQVRIDLPYPPCLACPYYKSKRTIVKSVSSENRPVVNFGLWGSDYKGPFPNSVGGNRYCVLFVERGTSIRLVYFTPTKNGTAKILPTMITDARRLHMSADWSRQLTIHDPRRQRQWRVVQI